MKNNKKFLGVALITLLAILSFTVVQLSGEKEDIIGTWVSEDTPEWKWVFKSDGKCYDYYDGVLTDTYTYTLSTSSPQCGQVVPTGDKFTYLKLVDDKDSTNTFCYEVFSLDKTNLEIRMFDRASFLRFVKQ